MYVLYKDESILSILHKDEFNQAIQDIKDVKLDIIIKVYLQYLIYTNTDNR